MAIYLDDQSGQLPSRNLDVYTADWSVWRFSKGRRTLFGAGAGRCDSLYHQQAQTQRDQGSVTRAEFTSGGDPNYDISAVINVPIVANTLAVRAVIYDDHHGGYINNVPATFTRKASDLGIHYANYATACDDFSTPSQGACLTGNPSAFGPPPGAPINNQAIAKKAINPVTYKASAPRGYGLSMMTGVLLMQTCRTWMRRASSIKCRTVLTVTRCRAIGHTFQRFVQYRQI